LPPSKYTGPLFTRENVHPWHKNHMIHEGFDDLTREQNMNYVLSTFRRKAMFKTVIQEAAALASLSLFVGMIAIWTQVLGNL
jgi:hypothetical protein